MQFNRLCRCETESRCWIWQTTLLPLLLKGNKSLRFSCDLTASEDRLKDKHNAAFYRFIKTGVITQGRGVTVSVVAQVHWCKFHPYSLQSARGPSMRRLVSACCCWMNNTLTKVLYVFTCTMAQDNISIIPDSTSLFFPPSFWLVYLLGQKRRN